MVFFSCPRGHLTFELDNLCDLTFTMEATAAGSKKQGKRRSRAVKNMRVKKRATRKFGGRKERLRDKVLALEAEKQVCLRKNMKLSMENQKFQR